MTAFFRSLTAPCARLEAVLARSWLRGQGAPSIEALGLRLAEQDDVHRPAVVGAEADAARAGPDVQPASAAGRGPARRSPCASGAAASARAPSCPSPRGPRCAGRRPFVAMDGGEAVAAGFGRGVGCGLLGISGLPGLGGLSAVGHGAHLTTRSTPPNSRHHHREPGSPQKRTVWGCARGVMVGAMRDDQLPAPQPHACSVLSRELDEPLAGTGAVAAAWLLVEQPGPWGRAAVTASRLDPALGAELEGRTAGTARPAGADPPGRGPPRRTRRATAAGTPPRRIRGARGWPAGWSSTRPTC